MNQSATSREEILKTGRDIVRQSGILSLNIRNTAAAANIATGTIYNYFHDKNDLLIQTVQSIWEEIFSGSQEMENCTCFCEYVERLYDSAVRHAKPYPDFLSMHAMAISTSNREEAKSVMNAWFVQMEQDLDEALRRDTDVDQRLFSHIDRASFISFVKDNILIGLTQKRADLHTFRLILERILYGRLR
ncbi:MAG: TetR/AcrR family transcriptional regulator [Bulleidia sp.]